MTDLHPTDPMDVVRGGVSPHGEPVHMLPAAAYVSPDVLAWERRHLFAATWTCLGRLVELLPTGEGKPVTQRAVVVGDIACLLVGSPDGGLKMFANTCRHRGHELLGEGETSLRRTIQCPYHAWTYDSSGSLIGAPGFRDDPAFDAAAHGLVELPVRLWHGWVFAHALHPVDSPAVPSFEEHLGEIAPLLAPYDAGALVLADRHTYEVQANWKVIAENYHECYHCPLIHPELCEVTPPDSGENYQRPGAWIGGSMDLREGTATMSLTGELAAAPLPGVDPRVVEYLHVLPNLLVSAHPDYVMTHRLVPLDPGRTWVECSWLVLPSGSGSGSESESVSGSVSGESPAAPAAVEFWDITNRQDWAACESVQRGLQSPHFVPGPFAPKEDAVAQLVETLGRAYLTGSLSPGA